MKKADEIMAAYEKYKELSNVEPIRFRDAKAIEEADDALSQVIQSATLEEMNEPTNYFMGSMFQTGGPILWHAVTKHKVLAEKIIKIHPDTLLYTAWHHNIFHIIAFHGHTIADELIALRAEECKKLINAQDSNGLYPIHIAIERYQRSAVDMLIKNGAELFREVSLEVMPLHLACKAGLLELVQDLIKAGADVNALTSFSGRVPLYYAAIEYFYNDIIFELLLAGANLQAPCSRSDHTTIEEKILNGPRNDDFRRILRRHEDCKRLMSFAESVTAGSNLAPEDIKWCASTGVYISANNDKIITCKQIIKEYISDSSKQRGAKAVVLQ